MAEVLRRVAGGAVDLDARAAVRAWAPAAAPARAAAGTGARRVLKSPVVRTVARAEVVAAEAERTAQAEAERRAELEAARTAGHQAGVEEARAAGAAAAERGAAALERLVETVTAREEREVAATSEAVLTAALEIAEWVLRRELADEGRSLLGRLEAGLTALLPSPTTRIAVSHADHAVVAEWSDRRGRLGTSVLADARLVPGDAIVTTDSGSADLTVAGALRAAREALGVGADEGMAP